MTDGRSRRPRDPGSRAFVHWAGGARTVIQTTTGISLWREWPAHKFFSVLRKKCSIYQKANGLIRPDRSIRPCDYENSFDPDGVARATKEAASPSGHLHKRDSTDPSRVPWRLGYAPKTAPPRSGSRHGLLLVRTLDHLTRWVQDVQILRGAVTSLPKDARGRALSSKI
jgi:hypothetical protein